MSHFKSTTVGFVLAMSLVMSTGANADTILFAQVNSSATYVAEGNDLASMLSDAGHAVTNVFLNQTVVTDFSIYDQVWVYDLSHFADNSANQLLNYANIASWYNGLSDQNLILDGRIISSADRWTSCAVGVNCPGSAMQEEDPWIQNYATQLGLRGGGLMLGTDHATAFTQGINNINSLIGVGDFTGFYGTIPVQATVDPLSPLFLPTLELCGYGVPANTTGDRCINDNSTTSFVPTGVQANGQELTPLAWHGTASTALSNAAVSTTMGSATFGTCGGPGQEPCVTQVPEPTTLGLLGIGLLGMGLTRRRHGKQNLA